MLSTEQKSKNLNDFLNGKGVSSEIINEQITDVFGEKCLIVATGSVVEGFGNQTSDVDLMCVVDKNDISQLPIMTYSNLVKFDTEYYSSTDIVQYFDLIRKEWPPTKPYDQNKWKGTYKAFKICCRLTVGLVIYNTDQWSNIYKSFDQELFLRLLCKWWYIESTRNLIVAKILNKHSKKTSEIRLFDAACSVLLAIIAKKGECVFNKKWISEKLKITESVEELKFFESLLLTSFSFSTNSQLYLSHVAKVENFLESVIPDSVELSLCCYLSIGVSVNKLAEHTVLSNWANEGFVLPRHESENSGLAFDREDKLVFCSSVTSQLPDIVEHLIANQFLWIGVYQSNRGEIYGN